MLIMDGWSLAEEWMVRWKMTVKMIKTITNVKLTFCYFTRERMDRTTYSDTWKKYSSQT